MLWMDSCFTRIQFCRDLDRFARVGRGCDFYKRVYSPKHGDDCPLGSLCRSRPVRRAGNRLSGDWKHAGNSQSSRLCHLPYRSLSRFDHWRSGPSDLAGDRRPAFLARANDSGRTVKFQFVERASKRTEATFYFGVPGKICSHIPPDCRQTAWSDEPSLKFSENIEIVIRSQKAEREGQP